MTKVTSDSRAVKKGDTFVAIKGYRSNGEDYIDDAVQREASIVVVSADSSIKGLAGVKLIKVDNPRFYLAQNAYGKIDQPEHIVAVTGTNGKTSVSFFYKQICTLLGGKSACIGTTGIITDGTSFDNKDCLTSPDPMKMAAILQQLHDEAIQYVAIEASSHGLSQYRVDGIELKGAVFTNLTQDHLDYHNSKEEYFQAKARLFKEVLPKHSFAVLNSDIAEFKPLAKICKDRGIKVFDYGKSAKYMKYLSQDSEMIHLELDGKSYGVKWSLLGEFQVYNIMAAVILAINTGFKIDDVFGVINDVKSAEGRLDMVADYSGAKIFIDYAHTPDALENVLRELKKQLDKEGRLIVVFGCGGDRDKQKRPMMGKIAIQFADVIIVTSDNPRHEDPENIIDDIMVECSEAVRISDRKDAIRHAMGTLQTGDIMLVAGKGHEDYQIIGDEKLHFSDREVILKHHL